MYDKESIWGRSVSNQLDTLISNVNRNEVTVEGTIFYACRGGHLCYQALKEAGIRDKVKIMAGGPPVPQDFVDKIGAYAYSANVASAVEKAKALMT